MTFALPPISPVRLRRTLGIAGAIVALSLGSTPALAAPLDGLLTLSAEPAESTPGIELRPLLSILDPALQPERTPAPALGLTPLADSVDDTLTGVLSAVLPGPSPASSREGATAPAADAPQGTGSASPGPTTGTTAPKAGGRAPGPTAVSPEPPASSGTATAAAPMPVTDAISRPIGPSRRSRGIAANGGRRTAARVRVAPLGPALTSRGPAAPAGAAVRPAPAAAAGARHWRPLAAVPHAAERVVRAVAGAGRSPWLPIALLLASVAYALGQRLIDGGAKLSHAGRDEPDDELIEL